MTGPAHLQVPEIPALLSDQGTQEDPEDLVKEKQTQVGLCSDPRPYLGVLTWSSQKSSVPFLSSST